MEVKIEGPDSDKKCEQGMVATVNYEGKLAKGGSVFDSSYKRGHPFSFNLD